MRTFISIPVLAMLIVGCGLSKDDGFTSATVGQAAREDIEHEISSFIPETASDFYYWDQGFLSDHTTYWSFRCDTLDDCKLAGHAVHSSADYTNWSLPTFPFIANGPAHFKPEYATDKWDVTTIRRGCLAIDIDYQDKRFSLMQFTAIDYDSLRVYRLRWYGDSLTHELRELGYVHQTPLSQ